MLKRRIKKFMTIAVMSVMVVLFSVQYVSAANARTLDDFSFWLDYTTGNPYDYSYAQPKTSSRDVKVIYSQGYYPVDVCVVAYHHGYIENIPLDVIRVSPGEIADINSWVYQSGYNNAALRGESCVDEIYEVKGLWNAEP